MFESVLRVKYISFKTCFVYLSPGHKQLNMGACIKLIYDENQAYFSASVIRNAVNDDSIGINSVFGKLLGINEGDLVNVSQVDQLPVVNRISVQPYSKADYEVLEIFSQNVQSNLLDQVRVINAGQQLIIWIGNSLSVSVIVDNVQPISPGVLDFLTEVVILPPGINKLKAATEKEHAPNFLNFLHKIPNSTDIPNNLFKPKHDLFYRLLPMSTIPPELYKKGQIICPFIGFVVKGCLEDNNAFYSVTLPNSSYNVNKVFIKLCFIEDYFNISDECFFKNNSKNIFLNDSVITFIQADFSVRVLLKKLDQFPLVTQIEVHSKTNYVLNIVEKLKLYLADHCKSPMIWNANFPLEIDKNLYCSMKFLPYTSDYCVIDGELLRSCSYSVQDDLVKPLDGLKSICDTKKLFANVSIAKDACDNMLSTLVRGNSFEPENIVVIGKSGTGKSAFLTRIATILNSYPYFVNTEIVQCKKIKGKTVDSIHKLFNDLFVKLTFCQPSLLILDDLNVLCERHEGEESPNSIYFDRVSEMLSSLFSTGLKHNSIGILASTDSVSKLNKYVYKSRGNHLFKNVFELCALTKNDRQLLLKELFKLHSVDVADSLDYDDLAIKTDGFVVQDLVDFSDKALFEAYKEPRKNNLKPVINENHCDLALKKSCALSLQNVKFHSGGNKSFDDIGGLHNVKNTLIESLLWPVKYSSVFANAPLRLQSGILLYGPPGTGKTLLAGAAAKQCNLRLISVKGPELLSKYIGGSEQAVRDVFDKAQRAKPCIIFFDEFDSLAPRRGHDNTGVTDRVVNQLLTQLDGVEALTGVCVLAASSRPDLLDPALLRPGRLDKQLLCDMPDHQERVEILQILSDKLDLAKDVKLSDIAEKTEGYSGADLQSVLYTAQISSIRQQENDDTIFSEISQKVLEEALGKTRPSLTRSERSKYDRIYSKFNGGNLENFKAGSKVTLA